LPLLLEDPKGSSAHRQDIPVAIAYFGLGGGRAAGAVDHGSGTGDPPAADWGKKVDIHLRGGDPYLYQGCYGHPHRVVNHGGVDTAVEGAVAVQVAGGDINEDDPLAWFYRAVLNLNVLLEGATWPGW
jgi:hypothetical protein